ncbi:unnamed protein product [Bursaphelenchus okinawaensis]|uniref:Hexosyltransferase n=1 Tax=Bursaphelenchus okinawaensis TaxID=465554 RepID=A0A811JQ08_9BILA|nr:unnamed protein product [Bursaphelenchus okinawaensis]CAG9076934.1 unnamed protein product [Bursaphelenchus okinawaensis]
MNGILSKKKFLVGVVFIITLTILLIRDNINNHVTIYMLNYVPQHLTTDEFEKLFQMKTVKLKIGETQLSYDMTVPYDTNECDNVEMVVYVMTMVDNYSFRRRQNIREIISKTTNRTVLFRFFLGRSEDMNLQTIVPEIMAFKDIVYYTHNETYRENYVKWYSMHDYHMTYCPNVKYFVKMDDDVTADYGRVFSWIDEGFNGLIGNKSEYFLCHGMYNFWPIRNKHSRWYIPIEEFSENRWPDYCFGYFILTTNDTIKTITKAMRNVNLVHMDDCFITGIVRRETTVPLLNWSGICSNPNEIDYTKCSKDNTIPWPIALHNTKTKSLVEKWLNTMHDIKCPLLE